MQPVSIAIAALLLSIVSGSTAAAVVLFGLVGPGAQGPGRIGVDTVVRVSLIAGCIFLLGVVGAIAVGTVDLFGLIHFVYLELVVGAPIVAASLFVTVAVTRRRPRPVSMAKPTGVLLGMVLLLAPLGFYMTHLEPYRLETDHVGPMAIDAARAGEAPVRIGVLTDWQLQHVGAYEVSAVDRLLAEKPDIILLPGDVFQDDEAAFQRELPALREQFNRLNVRGGAFLVKGDTDPIEHLRAMAEGTPVRFLDDEIVQTTVADRTITIGGNGLDYASTPARKVAHDLDTRPGADDLRILLTHRPDAIENLTPHGRTDLTVAGHTHGGQVALPIIGPLMTLSEVPRAVAAGGWHEMDGRRIYVGRGVGLERGQAPQMRLLVPPNIGILDLAG